MAAKKIRLFIEKLEDPEHPLLGPNIKVFRLFGMWKAASKFSAIIYLVAHFLASCYACGQLIPIFGVKNDLNMVLNYASTALVFLITVLKGLSFVFWRKEWMALITDVSAEEVRQLKKQDPIITSKMNAYKKYTRTIAYLYWIMCIITDLMLFSTPLLKYMSSKTYRENIRRKEDQLAQILYSWFPFNTTEMPGYMWMICIEIVLCGFECGVLAGYDMTAVAIMSYLKGQMAVLKEECRNLFKGNESRESIIDKIKECHRHHTVLVKQYKSLNALLSPIMFLYVLVCSSTIFSSVIQFNSSNITKSQKYLVIEYSAALVLQLLLYCWHGNEVVFGTKNVDEGVYESDWWKGDKDLQQLVCLLAAKLNTTLTLTAGPFTNLSVPTFVAVTYITSFLKNNTHPKLRQIDVTSVFQLIPDNEHSISIQNKSASVGHERMILGLFLMAKMTFENKNVQKLLRDPNEHFDLIIADWSLMEMSFSGIAKLYNAPLIWVSSLEPHWMLMRFIDESFNPAYSSDILSPKEAPFTFWERIVELWTQLKVTFYTETICYILDWYLYTYEIASIIKERGGTPPPGKDLKYNSSLVIANSHVSFGDAHRLPPNYIAAGGFHIDDEVEPLSGYLKKIMDNAKHGVIYFSMGSLIKIKDLPEETKQALIDMFGKLKQTVIWKFEEERTSLPNNVHMLKWAPQQSILAHPNCVLFITHGGLLSTMEAIHYNKTLIGLPVFADQFSNIERAVRKGFAKRVDLVMTPSVADDLHSAIEEVLSNPKYKEKVEQLSFIFHHRPVKPGAEILHWVEHVVKTGGAPHMRSVALMVPLYQKLYLDLLALILVLGYALRFFIRNTNITNILRKYLFGSTGTKVKAS